MDNLSWHTTQRVVRIAPDVKAAQQSKNSKRGFSQTSVLDGQACLYADDRFCGCDLDETL